MDQRNLNLPFWACRIRLLRFQRGERRGKHEVAGEQQPDEERGEDVVRARNVVQIEEHAHVPRLDGDLAPWAAGACGFAPVPSLAFGIVRGLARGGGCVVVFAGAEGKAHHGLVFGLDACFCSLRFASPNLLVLL